MSQIIGLTGGIASGKSTVARMLKELRIPVIDADEEARNVVQPGEKAYNAIVDHFGPEILLANGEIDRTKLGSIIFHNEKERQILNEIVHPTVRERMLQKKEQYEQVGHGIIVMDIPLLFESKLTSIVDKTIVVYVDEDVQLERLQARNGYTIEEAQARISSQMPLSDKRIMADAVINNNGSIEETRNELYNILMMWGYPKV